MKRVVKIGLGVLGLAILVGGGLVVLKGRQGAAPAAAAPTRFEGIEFSPADLTPAIRADLRQVVRFSGGLQPLNQSMIRAEVAAVVNEITVRRGERVKKGQLLARLDTADVSAKLREKQSNLDSARSALNLAQINREKAETLLQRGVKSQTAMDEAENAWRNARANVSALEQQLTMARKALGDAAIYAPIDGLVAERLVNPGERVAVDAKLFAIADLDSMEVEAMVPARDVPQLKQGQKVALRVEGFGDRIFTGQIDRINPTAQSGSRSIPVFILLANPDHVLRGGMFGSGEAVLTEASQAVAIPQEALRQESGASIVYVLKDGRVERRAVTVSLSGTAEGRIGIASGVTDGETVVVTPGLRLNDGLSARIAGR
jgi:membrane fusion protein, multidrug efflux system